MELGRLGLLKMSEFEEEFGVGSKTSASEFNPVLYCTIRLFAEATSLARNLSRASLV